jgi:hypothetical protein
VRKRLIGALGVAIATAGLAVSPAGSGLLSVSSASACASYRYTVTWDGGVALRSSKDRSSDANIVGYAAQGQDLWGPTWGNNSNYTTVGNPADASQDVYIPTESRVNHGCE